MANLVMTGPNFQNNLHTAKRAAIVKSSITICRQCFRPFNPPVAYTNKNASWRKNRDPLHQFCLYIALSHLKQQINNTFEVV